MTEITPETRQVRWLEEPYAQIGRNRFYPQDVSTLPKGEADQYIGQGWCECVENGEKGERKPGHVKMEVQDHYIAVK